MTDRLQVIADAYRRMASEANYRPAAPSDGLGNITVPADQLDLDDEIARYAERFEREDNARAFNTGCANFRTIAPTIYAIEAAREMCGGDDETAVKLLRLALASLN
jgi:hypothetical protein